VIAAVIAPEPTLLINRLGFRSVEFFDLSGWTVTEVFVETAVVEPSDVLAVASRSRRWQMQGHGA
jgi:hypothetical protein